MSCSPAAHPLSIEGDREFLCRRPIQFQLEEHLTFTPWLPLPIDPPEGFDRDVPRNFSVTSSVRDGELEARLGTNCCRTS